MALPTLVSECAPLSYLLAPHPIVAVPGSPAGLCGRQEQSSRWLLHCGMYGLPPLGMSTSFVPRATSSACISFSPSAFSAKYTE